MKLLRPPWWVDDLINEEDDDMGRLFLDLFIRPMDIEEDVLWMLDRVPAAEMREVDNNTGVVVPSNVEVIICLNSFISIR